MKSTVYSALAASVLALIPAANAQGFYGDVNYAFISSEEEDVDVDLGAITGHAGYIFNDYFAVEGELGFGVADESFSESGVTVDVGLNYVVGVYGVGILPVGDKLNLFARAGFVQAELEASASGGGITFSDSESDEGYALGVGTSFDFTDNVYLRADYTRYVFDEDGVNAIMIGVGYKL